MKKSSGLSEYVKKAKNSALILKKYPSIFLPDIFLFLTVYLFTMIFYSYSGIEGFLKILTENAANIEIAQELFPNGIWNLVIWSIGFFFFTFLMGAGTEAVRFSIVKFALENKKNAFQLAWKEKGKYFWRIVFMKMFIYIIAISAILVLGIFTVPALGILGNKITLAIMLVISLIIVLLFALGLLFRYAAMFINDALSWDSICKSFMTFKKHKAHTARVGIFVFILTILFSIFGSLIAGLALKLSALFNSAMALFIVSFVSSLAAFGIRLLFLAWSWLFVFSNYRK